MDKQSEARRLHALNQLNLLDTPPSESFDRITRMASKLFDLPIAAVSLTDKDRQWFKSRVGVDHWQIPREKAPCGEVADTAGSLVVPDLLKSEVYRDSLLAQSGIRFYAAAPLITREGHALGAMCVLGTQPRQASAEEQKILVDLAAMVMAQIELQHAFGRIEPISGLPNRHQLLEDMQDQTRDHAGDLRSLVIIELADATRMQEAIRVLGAAVLDDVMRDSAAALAEMIGSNVKLYQIASSQLAWVLSHCDEAACHEAMTTIRDRFQHFLVSRSLPAMTNPVIGVAPFRLEDGKVDSVLRAAHSAVQDARNTNVMVSVYSEKADELHKRSFNLIANMRDALKADDQLSLVFQPKIDLQSGRCIGAEALLRWHHPVFGPVSPGEFIPLVEQTEMVKPVTDWVIHRTIRQLQEWMAQGCAVPTSVNVSPANLEENNFAERLIEMLRLSGLPTAMLEVEVTEGALIRQGSRVNAQLGELRAAGVKVSIDDFGTGYSSLSYLQKLPADIVKIDQSFVRDLKSDHRARTLVHSMISLARGLDFRVIAEGIEDREAYAFLQASGCEEGQGYLISRPMQPDAFGSWVRDNHRSSGQAGNSRQPSRQLRLPIQDQVA